MSHPVLDLPLPERNDVSDLGRPATIRDFFRECMMLLWSEGEGFSGKRPLGNSGWEHQIYVALINAKLIEGKLDSDGYIERCDRNAAYGIIHDALKDM